MDQIIARVASAVVALTAGVTAVGQDVTREESCIAFVIQCLGGQVERDPSQPGSPVVEVDLRRALFPVGDTELALLWHFPELKRLNLIGANITGAGLARLEGMSHLEFLAVDSREITDPDLVHVRRLVHLRGLVLCFTGITDAGLVHLKDLKDLRELFLSYTKVKGPGLADLKGLENLEHLQLWSTSVGDAGLEHLRGLKKLRMLGVGFSYVTAKGVEDIQKALPGLEIAGPVRGSPSP